MKKSTKIIIGVTTLILLLINLYFAYHLLTKKKSPPTSSIDPTQPQYIDADKIEPPKKLSFTGTVKLGKDIPSIRDHCLDDLYLIVDSSSNESKDGQIITQLRSPDSAQTPSKNTYQAFVNQSVSVTGTFYDFDNDIYAEPNCSSDDYILVDEINLISRENTALSQIGNITLAGTITCLPEAGNPNPDHQDCTLGLLANNQHYALLNLADTNLVVKDSQIQVTGTINSEIKFPHPNTTAFNVLEIKKI